MALDSAWAPTATEFARLRAKMVDKQLPRYLDGRVRNAMAKVPRHRFVPQSERASAYEDRPLPIGFGQTISQPLMIAIMLDAAELCGSDRVLEVGTGSGYQAALLAELVREVHTIEIIEELADTARVALEQADSLPVHVITGDGSAGWPPAAPYDAIIVAAGSPVVPTPLMDQLADEGRLLIPVGESPTQILRRVRRCGATFESENLDACAFVPLVGEYAQPADRPAGRRGFFR